MSDEIISSGFSSKPFEQQVKCENCFCEWRLKENDVKCIVILNYYQDRKYFFDISRQNYDYEISPSVLHQNKMVVKCRSPEHANLDPKPIRIEAFITCPECNEHILFENALPPCVKTRIIRKDNVYVHYRGEFHLVSFTMLENQFCIVNLIIQEDIMGKADYRGKAFLFPTSAAIPSYRYVYLFRDLPVLKSVEEKNHYCFPLYKPKAAENDNGCILC